MTKVSATRVMAAMLAVLVACVTLDGPAAADGTEPLFQFPQATLSVRTAKGRVIRFRIWIADNTARQEQGLMYVRDLDEHGGMLFPYAGSRRITMWMKNTYLSLDMLFVDAAGRIDLIAAHTKPLTLDLISDPNPVSAVIELRGGAAERLGIHEGDQVLPLEPPAPPPPAPSSK